MTTREIALLLIRAQDSLRTLQSVGWHTDADVESVHALTERWLGRTPPRQRYVRYRGGSRPAAARAGASR